MRLDVKGIRTERYKSLKSVTTYASANAPHHPASEGQNEESGGLAGRYPPPQAADSHALQKTSLTFHI